MEFLEFLFDRPLFELKREIKEGNVSIKQLLTGPTKHIIRSIEIMYGLAMGKEIHELDGHILSYVNPVYVMGGVGFCYDGVKEGYDYPPYMFNKEMVGTILTGTNGISGGLLMSIKGYGTTDFPNDQYYLFSITDEGVEQLMKNLTRSMKGSEDRIKKYFKA